jgi:hypothetical protein
MPIKRREACRGRCETFGEENRVPIYARARAFLESVAKRQILITYQELANALQILPPHSIHRVTEALERGGRGGGPPVHRRARHQQQGAWHVT